VHICQARLHWADITSNITHSRFLGDEMKICSISARNFRTLQDFNIDFKPNYCAISGKNNAGKSAVIRLIQFFFSDRAEDRFLLPGEETISFARDATQWTSCDDMEVSVSVEIDREEDSEVFFIVQTFSTEKIVPKSVMVGINVVFYRDGSQKVSCNVNHEHIEEQRASEILKKFRSTSNLVVHNSTSQSRQYYYVSGSYTEVMETHFSAEDRRKILEAEKGLQTRVKRAARQHKEELEKLLGRLSDKYQVELSSIERGRSSKFPLELKLTDKSVEVPLVDWGAGTQNRTRVLMSVLDAMRMRSSVTAKDRSTPVFIVEEPESFLHPSAQAEFGQVLNGLAEELKIQIIATTHSPYMLNQSDPSANILLDRKLYRGFLRETVIKDTSGDDWMLPFASNLGIIPSEFVSWKNVFASVGNRVLLVEGDIDKEYLLSIREKFPEIYKIPSDVEIVPYGGKDSLKNTSILQFMINRLGRVFITFDLDAKSELKHSLERIGLQEGRDFIAIGIEAAGSQCIEGLLPDSVKKSVFAAKHETVSAMMAQDANVRRSAKSKLKRFLLDEFNSSSVNAREMNGFKGLINQIKDGFDGSS